MTRIAFLIALAAACSSPEAEKKEIPFPDQRPVKVRTQTVKRKPVTRKIIGEGTVVASEAFSIHSRGSGHVEKVFVKNGDRLKRGDTLLILEHQRQEYALAVAKIIRERHAYAYESERMGYDDLPPDTVLRAIRLSSGLAEAQMNEAIAKYDLQKQIIRSPSNGILLDWEVFPGQAINPQMLLGRLISSEGLSLEVFFPETDIGLLRHGVKGSGMTLAGDSLQCILRDVIPQVDKNGRIKTLWTLANPPLLIPGQHCAIEAQMVLREGIFIPRSAVLQRGDNTMVFISIDDTARWVNVQTGWHAEHDVEIRAGLHTGDRVVLSNQFAINEGTPIKSEIE